RGRSLAGQRVACRGPVLIAEAARGQGIYTAFNDATRQAYRERFDLGVLFVAADNPRSLHTSTTKLGAESLATFDVSGRRYHFLAYAF
ncbi:MAG: N-acetyltransferase, partial [Planctomycetia bacterium]